MNKQKRHLSFGTILSLCLTVLVSVGCVFMLSKMHADNSSARMSAQKVAGLIESVFVEGNQSLETPIPVRTVKVTIAPADASNSSAAASAATNAVPTSTPDPVSYSFTMTLAGLMGFHSDISDAVSKAGNLSQYQPILAGLSEKLNSDFNIGVFPHIICSGDQKYADVLAPVEVLDALKTAGFDDLLLNTEHALDQGIDGIEKTVEAINRYGFGSGGVNVSPATQNRLLQLNSAKIAMLSYTDSLTAKGKNVLNTAAGQNILTLFDLNSLQRDIDAAKAQGANCIIVFVHWGKEDTASVTSEQRALAQAIADMGGDVIIGFHPSRVLPIEMLESRNESGEIRQSLVAYSLGTLLTESRNGYDISGILLHLDITCSVNGKVKFNSIEYTPTYIWRQSINGNMQYRVICSSASPPEGMDKNQQEVMGRALTRIQNSLADSPVEQRE